MLASITLLFLLCKIFDLTLTSLQDYEYASYNPVAYDIANHFCEMAADYHTDTPHILDFSKYPGALQTMLLFFDRCCDFNYTFKRTSFGILFKIGLQERQRFVQTYLSSSGINLVGFILLLYSII